MATKPNYQSTNVVLFDKYGIRIYAIELPDDTPRRGPGRMLAERAAVKHLLREAFPGDRAISIGHLPSGAPFLTYADDPEGEDACQRSDMPPISISHCTRMAVLAIGTPGMRLGIDCESGAPSLSAVKYRIYQIPRSFFIFSIFSLAFTPQAPYSSTEAIGRRTSM